MSSTNKTQNYDLSQFVGSDKPAWLNDYNQDMNKIDNGIHTAQSTATSADGKAETNKTTIGELTALTTTNKTSVVNAINEVNGTATAAQNTANSANNKANTADQKVDGIAAYLNINSFMNNASATCNNGSVDYQGMSYASNSDASVGKIYGHVDVNAVVAQDSRIVLGTKSSFRPSSELIIKDVGITTPLNGNISYPAAIIIKTDGTVEIDTFMEANKLNRVIIHPSLLFIKDFGDQ